MSGKLTLRARGEAFVRTVIMPKGEPENFLTEAELREKFAGLADPVIGAEAATALAEAIAGLDRLNDVSPLLRRRAEAA